MMNADSNKAFAASPRPFGPGCREKTGQNELAAAAATHQLVIRARTTKKTQNNKCVLTSVSCVMTVTRLAWHPGEHAWTLDIVDDRVQEEGALQPRLVPLRVHEGGVRGTVQKLLVEQDAVDVLEQDAVDVLHCGSTPRK